MVKTAVRKEETPRTVNQFQFHGWGRDDPLLSNRLALTALLDMVERSQYKTGNHPIVIHCQSALIYFVSS